MRRLVHAATLAALLAPGLAAAVPFELNQQGRLFDSTDEPLSGIHEVSFYLYDAASGGSIVWQESHDIELDQGYYNVVLGRVPANPLDTSTFRNPVWVAISIDGGAVSSRHPVVSVPYAFLAETAANVSGGVVDATEIRIDGVTVIDADGGYVGDTETLGTLSCASGQIAAFSGSSWQCADDRVLTESELFDLVEGSPLSLADGSTVGGAPISTGDHYGDDDVQTYLNGGVVLGSSTSLDGAAIATGAHYADDDVQAYLDGGVDLGSGSTAGGVAISTGDHYDGADVDSHLASGVELGDGSTIGGVPIASAEDVESSMSDVVSTLEGLVEKLMPSSCPSDMALAGKAGTESAFCIEKNERSATYYQNAMTACAQDGRHVCTTNQWYIGSQTSGVSNMCNHNWEWTGSKDHAHTSGYLQILQGGAECTRKSWAWTDQHNNGTSNHAYRCCQGGISSIFE